MPTSRDVAKYFLSLVDEDAGDSISNLKMQKLVYYGQGFHLAVHGEPIFDEDIEAWTHGPVVPSLYHELKRFGASPVTFDEPVNFEVFDEDTKELLSEVYSVYGQFSATKLRNLTHREPPWQDTDLNCVIPKRAMQRYFETQLEP